MLRRILTLVLIPCLGCSGSGEDELDNTLGNRDASIDASLDGSSTQADAALADAGEPDAGLGELDTGAPQDADLDAEPTQPDAALDGGASTDSENVVYATFGSTLVRIDVDDAALTEVGVLTDSANNAVTYTDVVMAWSGAGPIAVATLGFLSPRLATVDLCTARVTVGATLTRPTPATPNLVVEGLARHTNGTWYVASGNSTQTLSRSLGTLDRATGVITNVGMSLVSSVQNDIDMLFFREGVLYGMDVATDTNRNDLFAIDLATGADSAHVLATNPDEPLRVAYDESRDKLLSWRAGDRNLLELDRSNLAATPLGETHPAGSYGGALVRGFFVAPAQACP